MSLIRSNTSKQLVVPGNKADRDAYVLHLPGRQITTSRYMLVNHSLENERGAFKKVGDRIAKQLPVTLGTGGIKIMGGWQTLMFTWDNTGIHRNAMWATQSAVDLVVLRELAKFFRWGRRPSVYYFNATDPQVGVREAHETAKQYDVPWSLPPAA